MTICLSLVSAETAYMDKAMEALKEITTEQVDLNNFSRSSVSHINCFAIRRQSQSHRLSKVFRNDSNGDQISFTRIE